MFAKPVVNALEVSAGSVIVRLCDTYMLMYSTALSRGVIRGYAGSTTTV